MSNMSADPPTTQVQCNQGADPAPGFSISSDNTLQYNGSSSFFACPASDIEWNVYVSPNFGQLKCVPITLKADGCGTQSTTCSAAPPTTLYQTQWTTQWTTQWMTQQNNSTVTVTETTTTKETETETKTETDTVTQPCTSLTTTTRVCNKCSRKSTSSSTSTLGWNTTTGWNATTTVCHKCVGTGTGVWTTSTTGSSTTSSAGTGYPTSA
jgi:hypothetical protein